MMTLVKTPELRRVEDLQKRIAAFAPTNDVEVATKAELLALIHIRRRELRREIVMSAIQNGGIKRR